MTSEINQTATHQATEAELELRAKKLVDHIEAKYFSQKLIGGERPCVGLVWELTGSRPHMAVDEIREMRSSFTDILAFLADPEIAEKFKKARNGNYNSRHFATHLKRVLNFLSDAGDEKVFAEMAVFDLENFAPDELHLQRLEEDFYK
jgi:hypothetical protein